MTILANLSNGNQAQIIVKGDLNKIVAFIEAYKGEDLGNELICESFVEDFEETGVIIENV
jgi:hypothetical protein